MESGVSGCYSLLETELFWMQMLCEGSCIKLRLGTSEVGGFFSGFVKKKKEKILTSLCLPFPDRQGD